MSREALPDVVAVALDVVQRLEALDVPYVIAGSFASSVHGEPRSTLDVDLVANLQVAGVDALMRSLTPDYYVDRETALAAVRSGGTFNAVHTRAGIKVDFFVAGTDPFEHERLRVRDSVELGVPPRTIWIDTAAHSLLRKLEWYRRGGETSDRQWRDILGIVRTQGDRLDRAELARWAPHLGVEDLLERCVREG